MSESDQQGAERRPLASRELPVFKKIATALVAARVSPNAISASSMLFGAIAGSAAAATSSIDGSGARLLWIVAAAFVQLRLLANMLDGMVAIESSTASRGGELFNEVPDRVSDAAILIGLGYAAGGAPVLGYIAAIVAVFVAYVRAMGASVGAGQVFLGPLAKPQRMFIVTVTCLYVGLAPIAWQPGIGDRALGLASVALVLIAAGGLLTAVRRLRRITSSLQESG